MCGGRTKCLTPETADRQRLINSQHCYNPKSVPKI